jgi:hypothetical protein
LEPFQRSVPSENPLPQTLEKANVRDSRKGKRKKKLEGHKMGLLDSTTSAIFFVLWSFSMRDLLPVSQSFTKEVSDGR